MHCGPGGWGALWVPLFLDWGDCLGVVADKQGVPPCPHHITRCVSCCGGQRPVCLQRLRCCANQQVQLPEHLSSVSSCLAEVLIALHVGWVLLVVQVLGLSGCKVARLT